MINVSNAFKNELFNDNRNYLEFVDITLADGTKLNLTNKDLWDGGLSIDDAVSADNSFDIGSAIINKCTIVIENLDDRFSDYDFNRAEVIVSVGLALPDGTEEKIHKGVFAVDEAKYNGSIITLSCLDNMRKFDKVYSESNLPYPATLNQIIRDACDMCDVTLQTYQFTHDDFLIETRPSDEATTFREVVAWCAQIAGCFARCDTQGRLELKWYNQELLEKVGLDGGIFDKVSPDRYTTGDDADGGSFRPWSDGDSYDGGTFRDMEGYHHIYANYSAPVLSTDDVVITGVRVLEKVPTENSQEAIATYLSGSEGYVVEISNNNLIQDGNGLKIADWLGEQLIGFRFRKAQLSHASDPTVEAGDVGFVTDRKQRSYPIIISSTRFNMNGAQTTNSSAADPIKNSGVRFSAQTKNYVESRRMVEEEKTDREKALEKLGERIDNSSGLYTTEKTQPDGSTVFYMHDKPMLEESMIVWEMTAETWSVSTDGGDTWNAGVTVDGDVIARILTAVGINAEWINTGQLTVRDSKGNVTFLADCNTGKVEIVADKFSLSSGKTIESIAEDKASSAVNDFISATYNSQIAELQKQLDGQIESFYYDYAPDLNKAPSNAWTSDTLKARHEGDLFFDKSTGRAYRFFKDGTSWKWQLIQDTDITKALAQAAEAKDTADKKRRTFLTQPTPPYDEGDLWYGGTDKDVLVCKKSREIGTYQAGDWGKADRYIDQAAANTAASNAVKNMSQTDVLNKLTNGGKDKGIYLQNGQLYISFSAARGGELTLGGRENGDGLLILRDETGNTIGRFDNEGFKILRGEIEASTLISRGSFYYQSSLMNSILRMKSSEIQFFYSSLYDSEEEQLYSIGIDRGADLKFYGNGMGDLTNSSAFKFVIEENDPILELKTQHVTQENPSQSYVIIQGRTVIYLREQKGGIRWGDSYGESDYGIGNKIVEPFGEGAGSYSVRGTQIVGTLYLDNDTIVSGSKSRLISTKNYGERLQYCYEMPSPMFGDIGEGITDESGECYIYLDDIFSETVSSQIEYQVFLQKEGMGDLWVESKESAFFVVKGTPNLKFAWEAKAIQKDYEYSRLDNLEEKEENLFDFAKQEVRVEEKKYMDSSEEFIYKTIANEEEFYMDIQNN